MIALTLLAWALAMTGWGVYWRAQAEDLMDENLTLRFGAEPITGKPQSRELLAVTPIADGGMDDLLLEVLVPPTRAIPEQRRPDGGA